MGPYLKNIFIIVGGRLASLPFMLQAAVDLIMWPIASRVLGLSYKKEVRLKDGFRMYGSMQDILSRQILFLGPYKTNLWEPATSLLLERLSKGSAHTLIAGAHMGYLVLKASLATRGKVHTFEPIPELFLRSQENIALNPALAPKIALTQAALGEGEGIITMYAEDIRSSAIPYSGGHVQHERKLEVPLTTIDAYARKHQLPAFDLILLDIEGFEWQALNGAIETLASRPKLILEVSPRVLSHTDITPEMIFERLRKLGYELFFIDDYAEGETLVPVTADAAALFLMRDYVNVYATANGR